MVWRHRGRRQPPTSQGERPGTEPPLTGLESSQTGCRLKIRRTSSLQSCETVSFCFFKSHGLWYFAMAALASECTQSSLPVVTAKEPCLPRSMPFSLHSSGIYAGPMACCKPQKATEVRLGQFWAKALGRPSFQNVALWGGLRGHLRSLATLLERPHGKAL